MRHLIVVALTVMLALPVAAQDYQKGLNPDFPDGVDNFRPFETILI